MRCILRFVMVVLVPLISGRTTLGFTKWHQLYLDGGGYWRQRLQIQIRNEFAREAVGEPVAVRIGRGVGEADLVGAMAEAVRVCDAKGTEMLFSITGPAGQLITKGPIPAGSILTIPAECPANSEVTYYIYFDNPEAWAVPDFLEVSLGVRNGGLEEGVGDVPFGWRHDPQDEQHRLFWVTENPRSGKRCLKTVVAEGAEPTWIATRQFNIHIIGGARYTMRAWVKAENVKGYAGWYIHVGNQNNPMIIAPMLSGGGGTYNWKEVSAEFVAPEEANIASLGTVLRGTGTAWFDDVTLECHDPSKLTATAADKPERFALREIRATTKWYDDNPRDDLCWDYRIPIKVMNFHDEAKKNILIYVDTSIINRLRGKLNEAATRVTDGVNKLVPYFQLNEGLVFEGKLPPRTIKTYYVYFSTDDRIKPAKLAGAPGYEHLMMSPRNLVKNPSFEVGEKLPSEWSSGAEGERPVGTTMGLDQPAVFGRRCAKIHIPHGAKRAWTGWRQDVPVEPGKTYLFSAWLKCEDIRDGSVQLHAHYRNAEGKLCKSKQYASAGPAISGTTDWTLMFGIFDMPEDIATFQLHLTMFATGTVWHDGVILAEVLSGRAGRLEAAPPAAEERTTTRKLMVWPVNAIVKVFQEDTPPRRKPIPPARITVARNEKEPLQLAIRSSVALKNVQIEVDPPTNRRGAKLTDIRVGVVGYVPIDHKTNYYVSESPPWHRKFPTGSGSCDGWPGMWPDPLLPRSSFDLPANTTQPIWVTVSVPKDAEAGDYLGKVRLISSSGKILKEIPFSVRVWDFTLPDENHIKAIYDLRLYDHRWHLPGKTLEELYRQFWRFMAEYRVCPDTIYPAPRIKYEDGKVIADFTEFDKAAEYYLNELKFTHFYTPWDFYLFGWGHPPGERWGQKPYEGDYPYEGVDRSKLREEFKRAYQACLKVFWEHLKEKGWDKKCVLYISDEPFYDRPHIRAQMKALCDMIHEVDPEIPIYCSTWRHCPEWDGYLDVWGIGHYGIVTPEKMKELRARGDCLWFTTDGQMCIDTPYCAIERLLPHYCFKYDIEAYEFWGISWLTYNPYEFGWHSYIRQSDTPGKFYFVRYPNGDGYLAYPGAPIGHDGPVSSVRLEQAREGVEDYEYLYLLRELIAKAKAAGKDTTDAEKALALANRLVDIPNAGGRFSTKILPNPDAVLETKEALATAIEALLKAIR